MKCQISPDAYDIYTKAAACAERSGSLPVVRGGWGEGEPQGSERVPCQLRTSGVTSGVLRSGLMSGVAIVMCDDVSRVSDVGITLLCICHQGNDRILKKTSRMPIAVKDDLNKNPEYIVWRALPW